MEIITLPGGWLSCLTSGPESVPHLAELKASCTDNGDCDGDGSQAPSTSSLTILMKQGCREAVTTPLYRPPFVTEPRLDQQSLLC